MEEICRLCASQSSEATSIHEHREGLPISVIIMIICPVKIETSDNLPKYICEGCLEVVLSAYSIRSESLKSDKYFRECDYESEVDKYSFEDPVVKEELLFVDSSVVYETSTKVNKDEEKAKSRPLIRHGNYIDCSKSLKKGASTVWSYIGTLCDETGGIIDTLHLYCKLCNKKFKKRSSQDGTSGFWKHLATHKIIKGTKSGIKKITSFNSPSEAQKTNFSCDLCPKAFNIKPKIELHMENVHTISNLTSSSSDYKVICQPVSAKSVSLAWKYFGILVNLDGSDVEAHRDYYHCKVCVEEWNTLSSRYSRSGGISLLKKHLRLQHPLIYKEIKMQKRKEFSNQVDQSTSREPNSETPEFICHVCSKSFSRNSLLTKHIQTHLGKSHFCSQCPASFSYSEGLNRHELIHQPNHFSRYKCDMCSKAYATKSFLKVHLMEKHFNTPREKKAYCTFCDMKFINVHKLQIHLRKHTGEKPFACQYCSGSFTQKGELLTHLQRIHIGDAVYKCTIAGCKSTFRLQIQLREHYKVHYRND